MNILQRIGLAKNSKETENKEDIVLIKCPACGKQMDRQQAVKRKYACVECGAYFRVKTINRIKMVADAGSFKPWFTDFAPVNPLDFEGYDEKLQSTREKTGLDEALTVGECKIYGERAVIGICDARFMMASMGHIVGEKLTLALERAVEESLPVFVFCCSGGARMQEGIISLMQMAKTSAAIERMGKAGLLYSTILTDPTTGGVTASFAMLGDVIMAEPGALIGFAGPRVIRQTIGQELPEGFQSAEFLVEQGIIDGIVRRENLKKTLYFLIKAHECKEGNYSEFGTVDNNFSITEILGERMAKTSEMTAWEKVKAVRAHNRPQGPDYMRYIFDYFEESHGDGCIGDDGAIIGGIGFIGNQPITVITENKGRDIEEYQKNNFGMPMPWGYKKALRLMKQAEKFNRPIICFVNTPGAYPGIEAEEMGMGRCIAENLYAMAALKVPVLCILIGEGGSGGALATAVGNEVWMLENATYSILSPEGFASILWKDANKAPEASRLMKMTANELKEFGVIEKIIPEFGGADEVSQPFIAKYLKREICNFMEKYRGRTGEEIRAERYERFRKF